MTTAPKQIQGMTPSRDIFAHLVNVDRILAFGGTVTSAHRDIRNRWQQFTTVELHGMDRLRAAVIDGEGDLEEAYSDAIIDHAADGRSQAIVNATIAREVLAALTTEYATTAASNYATAADRYNSTAKRLSEALAITDPDAPEGEMIGVPRKISDAYLSVPLVVLELEQHLDDLALAARLAGVYNIADETMLLPLAARLGKLHRRRVWEAWQTSTGRAGRFGALIKAGATLAAPATVGDLQPYREPEPIQVKQHRVEGAPRGTWEKIETDPEDEEFERANGLTSESVDA